MKPFKGPKFQGGWIGIAAAVVGGIATSASNQSAAKDKNKMDYNTQRDLSELQFQQQNWLQQQSHKWAEEDAQRATNYKEDAIRGFGSSAPENALDGGEWGAPPQRTVIDTSGLAQTQANGQPLIYDPRTKQPILGDVAAQQQRPLNQFAGGRNGRVQG